MAKIIFSPLIAGASGKTADAVFGTWKGRSYVRKRVIPSNPQSAAQTEQREAMARVVPLWRSLASQIKAVQDTYGTAYSISGYNWFVKQNVVLEKTNETRVLTPTDLTIDPAVTFVSSPAGAGRIKADWTGGMPGAAFQAYLVCRRILPTVSDEIEIISEDAIQFANGTLTSAPDWTSGATYITMLACERVANHGFSASRYSSVLVA